jgi:aldose 1-epimerase
MQIPIYQLMKRLIPTGEIRKVEGTPFDFTSPKKIGKEINAE